MIGVMEIVMQRIHTEWTKRFRGAPEATVHNGVRNSRVFLTALSGRPRFTTAARRTASCAPRCRRTGPG